MDSLPVPKISQSVRQRKISAEELKLKSKLESRTQVDSIPTPFFGVTMLLDHMVGQLLDGYSQVLIVQKKCIDQYVISLILFFHLLVKQFFIIEFSSQQAEILTYNKDMVNFFIAPFIHTKIVHHAGQNIDSSFSWVINQILYIL